MNAAAVRFLLGLAVVALLAASEVSGEAATRVAPLRPAPLSTTVFNGTEYVSATDVAIRLRLRGTWTEPMRKLTLAGKTGSVELKADSRDVLVNGLRVFLGDKTMLQHGQLYVSRIDFERCLTPLLRPGLGVDLPPMPKIIALDPGHGGLDEGAENKTVNLKEKLLTLDVALRLRKLLEAAGYMVVMIRTDDQPLSPIKPVDLALRPEFANRAHADLFISIHFNAAPKDTRGTEVFT
jgi:N-acetylmuramoyl-L-alanine amidase